MTLLGGLIGIAAGLGPAHLLDGRSIGGLGNNVQTVVSRPSVGIAFVVSVAISLFFRGCQPYLSSIPNGHYDQKVDIWQA